jgi:hypothetical protein
MSLFEDDRYQWRETYFVLFDASRRPSLEKTKKALGRLSNRFQFHNWRADDQGAFESVTLLAPEAYAAIDISYLGGEDVQEESAELAEEMRRLASDAAERTKVSQIAACNARFDVLHFAEVTDDSDEESEEMLDPAALLLVVEALCEMTGGVAVDPQAQAFM